ncbi:MULTISPECIES: hypothetical protein [Alishewanella]|nr:MULTISPECIES: hypothetical protein [Alishewanella]
MKEMIFAFLLILPSVLLVENTPNDDDKAVSPLSWCWINNTCKNE